MTDYTTGWHLREVDRNTKRAKPWPVWEHPQTDIIIAQTPHGTFNLYHDFKRIADGLTFTQARREAQRRMTL